MNRKQELKEVIARVAYEIYERRGTHGLELEDWLVAERMVLGMLSDQEPSKAGEDVASSRKKGKTAKKKCR